jgi:hypothetical protein
MIEEQEQQPTQDLWEYEFEGKKIRLSIRSLCREARNKH